MYMVSKKVFIHQSCILVLLTTALCVLAQPVWDKTLDFQNIEERLKNEPIVKVRGISDYLRSLGKNVKADKNYIKHVRLQSGLQGVFKTGWQRYGERAAYKACKALGQRLVPPTVMRTIDGQEGSLQFFVDSSIDLKKGSNADHYFDLLDPKDRSDMHIFYFVFGQWDAHKGNQIITKSKHNLHLALIDNAVIYFRQHIRYGDFPFVAKGAANPTVNAPCTPSFPFASAKKVRARSFKKLHEVFSPFTSHEYIRELYQDADSSDTVTYCLWCDKLWVKQRQRKSNYTKKYYASTLEAYKKLSRDVLEEIWSDCMKFDPDHCNELIDLILERRDQLLEAAYAHGTIIKDETSS